MIVIGQLGPFVEITAGIPAIECVACFGGFSELVRLERRASRERTAVSQTENVDAGIPKSRGRSSGITVVACNINSHFRQRVPRARASRILKGQCIAGSCTIDNQYAINSRIVQIIEYTLAERGCIRDVHISKTSVVKKHIVTQCDLTITGIKCLEGADIFLECTCADRYRNTVFKSYRFQCSCVTLCGSKCLVADCGYISTNGYRFNLIAIFHKCLIRYCRYSHSCTIYRNSIWDFYCCFVLSRNISSKASDGYDECTILVTALVSEFSCVTAFTGKSKCIIFRIQDSNERLERFGRCSCMYGHSLVIDYLIAPACDISRKLNGNRGLCVVECASIHRSQLFACRQIPAGYCIGIIKGIAADTLQLDSL